MKKFALLMTGIAFVGSAFAVTPEQNPAIKNTALQNAQTVQMKHTLRADKAQTVRVNEKAPVVKAPAKAEGFSVSYTEPEGLMNTGLSNDFYGLMNTIRLGANYTPVTFTNTSTGATEYEWEFEGPNATSDDPDYQYVDTQDLTYTFPYTIMSAPTLYASGANGESGEYAYYPGKLFYQWGAGMAYNDNDYGVTTDMLTSLYVDPEDPEGARYSRFGCMAYNPGAEGYAANGLDDVFSDAEPDGYGMPDSKFVGYGQIFPKTNGTYVISKIWCWAYGQAKKNTVVEITLYKIDEDGFISDEILAKGSCNYKRGLKADGSMLEFDLFSVDEDGLETDDPILVDCAFAAIMRFNVEDLKEMNMIGGIGYQYPVTEDKADMYPGWRALIVLENDGEEVFYYSPYRYYGNDARTTLMDIHDWAWMVDATYTWLFDINGDINITAPAEGGEVVFNIESYYNLGYFFQEGLAYSDAEWIDPLTLDQDEETGAQVLTIAVEPLPEGETGRVAVLEFDPLVMVGCPNTLTITQGEAGVSIVASEGAVKYYDLAGRQVANPEKGLYIKVEGNKAQKVIL